MKRKAWLLLAVVPVLLAAYAVKRCLIPASVSGGEASVARRAQPDDSRKPDGEPNAVTASESTPQKSPIVQPLPKDLDPFAVLDRQYEAWQAAVTARFDGAEARVRASVQPALDASVAEHKREVENLDRMNLNANQKMQRNGQFNVKYEKARLDIKRTIQPELDELAVKRRDALARLESDRAQKRTRLQEIQALAEQGQIDPIAAKQAQFEVLGISLPPSAFQTPQERRVQTDAQTAPPKEATPKVQAIVATGDDRFCALVEDSLASEGDTIQGYRVLKIRADSVEFEKDGRTWVQKAD